MLQAWLRHSRSGFVSVNQQYNRGMNENLLTELSTWRTQAGLAETDIVSVFCERCARLGFRLVAPTCLSTCSILSTKAACSAGAIVLTNPLYEYGRTSSEGSRSPVVHGPDMKAI